ncbi:MAG: metal-dependent phosphohydrolase [Treponema sp.]|nr:metal-dependent phosphohydrolase [Treponema sp.]
MKEQKFRLVPFNTLYENDNCFWQAQDNWKYFFTEVTMEKLKTKNIVKAAPIEPEESKDDVLKNPVVQAFGVEYEAISSMSSSNKVKYLNEIKNKIDKLSSISVKTRDENTSKVIVDSAKYAVMISYSALKSAFQLEGAEAKKATQTLVYTTHEIVKSYTQLFSKDIFDNLLMSRLFNKSNGTIIQHITRVYLMGIAFLAYYNKFVSNRADVINMRKTLNAKYRQYYQNLLPHISIDDIVLERVFHKGMLPIPPDLFVKWAVGFLIHDIGKASAVEYHEGEASYDRSIVMEHVRVGYNFIVNKTNYPKEASLITGYHHEYYGNPEGYGYFRIFLENYKKKAPQNKQDFCMTFDMESILNYKAFAYFPAKILEIVDVYDSVTDPNRVYRKPLSSGEALVMMRKDFITNQLKIDPILFELFTSFTKENNNQPK